jgi:PAS domain S-box-containing protein
VWSSLPDGSVDFINQRWLDFSGLSLGQALDRGWEDALHPEDHAGLVEAWRGAIGSGSPMEYEARVRSADGQYRWLLIRNVPLRDDAGKVVKWYGTSTDIDDRKRAEQALRQSEAYLADAQKLTHTGAWASDAMTRPLYWSDEVFRIFGFDPEHGLPPPDQPLERVHPDDRDKFWTAFQRTIQEKVDSELEYRVVLPDDTVKHVHAVAHPVAHPHAEPLEVVGTIVDVTERKRAEAERERLRELEAELAHINRVSMMGELAASIAHEVNQPLTGIVSNGSACLRWLAGDAPNLEEARDAVRDIVRDGKRAGEVITRIRALTKRSAPPQEKLDLNETIREVLALVGHEATKNSVTVRTAFADELFPVIGDRVQLQQVVLNLVMNAIEAMSGDGERAREVVITTRNMDTDQVRVSVEDSGPGLDPNAMSRIFDPFYTTKSGGMGMGLSISRSILQNHGGRLWVTANHGPGTSFHFSLPKYREELSYAAIGV